MFGHQLPLPLEALAIKMLTGYSPQICIVGDETGIGKSMLACYLAEMVYFRAYGKVWKPEGNLFFRIIDFKNNLFESKQRIFIMEEVEIELGSDSWQSPENRYFSRMKSTQRIKGNLYVLVLPIFMLLAKKSRLAVNYIFDVKSRGFCNVYKIVKKASQVTGDEIGRFYIGSLRFFLPECKKEFDKLDHANKNRIEKEHGIFLEEVLESKKNIPDKIIYEYTCFSCGFVWRTKSQPERVKICKRCKLSNNRMWNKDNPKVIRLFK